MICHANSRSYTAYGVVRGVLSGSRLAFCGECRDPLTEHYLLGNGRRAYNPALMRFNSPDTLSPFGRGGINTYAYCLNDPINRVDRNGAFSFLSSVYFAALAEGALNVVDGLLATLKLIVQSRQLGPTPSFSQQLQVVAKTQKGIAKIAASAYAWKAQGAPSIPSVTDSVIAGVVATGLGNGAYSEHQAEHGCRGALSAEFTKRDTRRARGPCANPDRNRSGADHCQGCCGEDPWKLGGTVNRA